MSISPIVLREIGTGEGDNRTPLRKNSVTPPLVSTVSEEARQGIRGGGNGEGPISGLIFDADWDNQDDWRIQHANQRYVSPESTAHDGTSGIIAKDNVPPGFDFYYTSQWWHPDGDKNGGDESPGNRPVGEINNAFGSHDSPTGKSFIMYDESYGGPGQWGADCLLLKHLGASYPELWCEFYIRFDPGWVWQSDAQQSGTFAMKLFRAFNWRGNVTQNRFNYFGESTRDLTPRYILDLKAYHPTGAENNQTRIVNSLRGYTTVEKYGTEDDYFNFFNQYPTNQERGVMTGGGFSRPWSDVFLDNEWHKINIRLCMDSTPGAGDGIVEFWVDDFLEMAFEDIPWRQIGDPNDVGFNTIGIGGNINNVWLDPALKAEQWYALSGLKLYSAKPIGGN